MDITSSKRLASLPPYPFAGIDQMAETLRMKGIKPIDFGAGDPSEPTPDLIIDRVASAAQEHAATGYPSYIGSWAFRTAAADYMKRRFGVVLDPDTEIASSAGSKEAIFNFPEGFIDPSDIVICPSPGYPPFKTGTIFAEGIPYFVPLHEKNDFLIDYEAIPAEVAKKAKVIWLNYPNSPTGAVATREYYKGLVDWAQRNNIIVASDEGCYIDIYFGEPPPSVLEVAREGIVAFYSLSKRSHMTGYRVGFVCGDERIIGIFKRLKTNIDSGVANIIQEAGIAALADDTHPTRMRDLYRKKRDILTNALRAMGFDPKEPEATFYVWLNVRGSDVEFAKNLLEPVFGIIVTPGSLISERCADGSNPGEGYVRFALMPPIPDIEEAVRRLHSFRMDG